MDENEFKTKKKTDNIPKWDIILVPIQRTRTATFLHTEPQLEHRYPSNQPVSNNG